jgi:hypothetical protein
MSHNTRRNTRRVVATLIALGATFASTTTSNAMTTPLDTGVRDASGGTGNPQTEQTLAVDPSNPDNAIISYIDLGMSVTHDGGLTWHFVAIGTDACPGDNNPVFDQTGTAYYQCDNQAIVVSHDHGETWGVPVVPYNLSDNNGDLADRPWLVRGTQPGTLYLGFESFFTTAAPGFVFIKRTTDSGATWPGPSTRVDNPTTLTAGMNPRQYPAVGGDGALYVSYQTAAWGDVVRGGPVPKRRSHVQPRRGCGAHHAQQRTDGGGGGHQLTCR